MLWGDAGVLVSWPRRIGKATHFEEGQAHVFHCFPAIVFLIITQVVGFGDDDDRRFRVLAEWTPTLARFKLMGVKIIGTRLVAHDRVSVVLHNLCCR